MARPRHPHSAQTATQAILPLKDAVHNFPLSLFAFPTAAEGARVPSRGAGMQAIKHRAVLDSGIRQSESGLGGPLSCGKDLRGLSDMRVSVSDCCGMVPRRLGWRPISWADADGGGGGVADCRCTRVSPSTGRLCAVTAPFDQISQFMTESI